MYDFEMEYTERILCHPDDDFKCMDDNGYWHAAAGPICEDSASVAYPTNMSNSTNISNCASALPEYIDIKHTMLFDTATGAASETIYNAEYPASTLHKYRSAERTVTEQIEVVSGEAFYCRETEGRIPVNWNVTEAKKVGESLATDGSGKIIRHFTIQTAISEIDFAFLTKNAYLPYTGYYNIEYYDEKDSGAPVRFVLPAREFIITKYVEKQIDMPPPQSTTWDPSASCRHGDPTVDLTLPAKMPDNVLLFNHRDRRLFDAMAGGTMEEVNATGFENPYGGRKLLGKIGPDCAPEGSCWGYEETDTVFGFKVKSLDFAINAWRGSPTKPFSCGLSDISFEAKCPWGATCYGSCAGTTPLLCRSGFDMECELGIELDPIDSIKNEKIREALRNLLPNAMAGIKLTYAASTKTVSITGYGQFSYGNMNRRRKMLATDEISAFPELSSDAEWGETVQDAAHQAHKRKLANYSPDRKLLWGGDWDPRKNGIAVTIEGTGSYSIEDGRFGFSLSVSGEICFLGGCGFHSASVDIGPGGENLSDCEAQCYLNRYSDIKNAFGNDLARAKQHWKDWGRPEGRNPTCLSPCELSDCQAQSYLNRYSDLKNAFGNDLAKAKQHWKDWGLPEGRDGSARYPCELSDCEAQCYLNRYSELKNALGNDPVYRDLGNDLARAKAHWKDWGLREGRDPTCRYPCELSDCQAQCYLNRYSELKNALGNDPVYRDLGNDLARAKAHWKDWGLREGRNPTCRYPCTLTNYEAQCYLNRYSDLKNALGNDVAQAKQHWKDYGLREGRNPIC